MPDVNIQGGMLTLPRNIALIDTNLVVARFDPNDEHHAAAVLTLDEDTRYEWVLTGPVLVESCGMILSRAGAAALARFFSWVVTPGRGIIVMSVAEGPNEHSSRWQEHAEFSIARNLDFVDAYLMRVATILSKSFGGTLIPIATADSDFYRGGGTGYCYGVLDYRELTDDIVSIR